MKISILLAFYLFFFVGFAHAEGGCPPGQYPIGGQGAMACTPLPQDNNQQQARPSGKWIKTWGAIAMGSIDSVTSYGVTTGKLSKAEAEADALSRCGSHGETNCQIGLAYKNQCAVVAEPHVNDKPFSEGYSAFIGASTVQKASDIALNKCNQTNREFSGSKCAIVYSACSEPIFEKF
ncbi:DUF4189 domain-containing protein [Xanthomonas arboricola]|uniref:DUF4189 domain-containing protein n=1 Tax=Xanthomonas arboricola TaxID=56448 RepID=UPI001EE8B8AA|nr:DUF4189 domain-containing protein [Xanthomonas arboricola]